MKRRVAPRLMTALIATVLVGRAAVPGVAGAATLDAPSPEAEATPVPGDQQPEAVPTPAPEATPTPEPTRPTPSEPAPQSGTPTAETPTPVPSPKAEKPRAEKPEAEPDDSSTPADSDLMPVGPLQRCIAEGLDGQEANFGRTKKLTTAEVNPTCALPAGTLDPDDLPAMDDWSGAEFLPGITTLTVTGFDGVSVPSSGLSDFEKVDSLSLADNSLTELPDLGALPELTSLDVSDNKLTELTVPTTAEVPQLAELDVSKNRITDVSGVADPAVGPTITATDQTLTHPDITARATQQLADVITVPTAWTNPSWKPGEKQMAAADRDAGTFFAARPGTWSLSWTVREGKVSYSGSTTGDATAPEPQTISFTTPGAVPVGESATYRADVSNLPAAVRSELDYQWYRGTSTSKLKPVDGATGQVFTIDSVDPDDDGSFVNLVATADGAAHRSTPALLAVTPVILDGGFRECLDERFPDGYDSDDLAGLRSLDCSGRGIDDLNDLPTIDGDGNVSIDLSNNLITDLSRDVLISDDDEMRTKQLNLSDNLIEDVTPLGDDDVDLSSSPANLIVLDGNRIRDVSSLGDVEVPDDLDPAPISVRRQVVDLPAVEVGDMSPRPTASSVTDEELLLTRDGQAVGDPVTYPTRGVDTLTWEESTDGGVAFGGAFVVPVGSGLLLGLTFPTDTPTGGDTVSVRGYGFQPGDVVTLRAEGDDALFNDEVELEATADLEGNISTTFTLGYLSGRQVVKAKDQSGGVATAEEFTLVNDEEIPVPDDALRACINQKIGEDDNATTYRSRLNRITSDFSCRNAGVKDLTGLEELPSPSIDLTSNDVTSLDTVKSLNDATTSLNLTNNELDDLGEVEDQPDLRRLNLSQNRLINVSDLDEVTFADDAQIIAAGQTIRLSQRVVGQSSEVPAVVGLDGDTADLDYPDQATVRGSSVTWTEAGDQRIDFALDQDPQGSDDSDDAVRPGLELTGSFAIRVVNAPPAVQPPSNPPAQQVPVAAEVPSLAPASLVERIEREDEDEDQRTAPRAVALGPEVALEEVAPTPRTVTNPTVEKRDPITSVSGWGLTATGWSFLGAALLAMALAVGVAVLTLGRSTR